ncbi:MAG TPA: Glu/Leu/Phe/Val dehydrogenase dimerization domain-containing protein [Longimicrobium sp.]|jgi:glutamate dehydrogenase/leucine dehydrogenase|nr:Glu/Leu/Phe/Val dehydrogenase dimerization domain-containing protein [Longimicrobium sp.]
MHTSNDERHGHGDVRTVKALHHRFQQAGVRRACIVLREGEYRLFVDRMNADAPPLLPVLSPYLPPPGEWEHEAVFIGRPSDEHPEIDTLFFAFVHNTQRGLAQGGLRLRDYSEIGELEKLFEDGLRLSQGMTMKNAMARLWWGGGKGIIAETPDLAPRIRRAKNGAAGGDAAYPQLRAALFEEYGRFVSEIGGVYYTAADMNTDGRDMLCVLRATRFVTCLPPSAGGSADPSPFTADGVFCSIKAAWKFLGGTDSLRDVRVAVQGAGKVGGPLVMDLLQAGARVWAGDTSPQTLEALAGRAEAEGADLARLTLVRLTDDRDLILRGEAEDPDAILRQEVDVIAPCAGGQTINHDTIAQFARTVKLVCGAANNMLGDEDADAALLHERAVCYVPDFVCNRMGIMNCADEWMGYLEADSRTEVERVVSDVEEIVGEWKNGGTPTLQKGREMALRRLAEEHPLERMHGRGAKLLENYLRGLTSAP